MFNIFIFYGLVSVQLMLLSLNILACEMGSAPRATVGSASRGLKLSMFSNI